MVIGNGLIARGFKDYINNDHYIIYASGVSNSKNTEPLEYERELNLLQSIVDKNPDKFLVYFSTLSVYDESLKDSEYVQHKLKMEDFLRNNAAKYFILRLSNVVGHSSNPYQIFNFITQAIRNQRTFTLWTGASRNLIDIRDVYVIGNNILKQKPQNNIYNICSPFNYSILDIAQTIASVLNQEVKYTAIDKKSSIPKVFSESYIEHHFDGIDKKGYLHLLAEKYCK